MKTFRKNDKVKITGTERRRLKPMTTLGMIGTVLRSMKNKVLVSIDDAEIKTTRWYNAKYLSKIDRREE